MIKGCKICGISDPKTLTYIVNHPHPPQFVGFIVNWKASSRYVELHRLKELLNIDKKKSKYVAVVVKNDENGIFVAVGTTASISEKGLESEVSRNEVK